MALLTFSPTRPDNDSSSQALSQNEPAKELQAAEISRQPPELTPLMRALIKGSATLVGIKASTAAGPIMYPIAYQTTRRLLTRAVQELTRSEEAAPKKNSDSKSP